MADFKRKVHFKGSFSSNMRMERLLCVLKGEGKKSVESIGKSGIFCAIALKTLKVDFGNSFTVTCMKLIPICSEITRIFDKSSS